MLVAMLEMNRHTDEHVQRANGIQNTERIQGDCGKLYGTGMYTFEKYVLWNST
jgi:hypothetical protein